MTHQVQDEKLQELVVSADAGARNPRGPVAALFVGVMLAWSIFQLWIASPLPFMIPDLLPVLNSTQTRSIHLAFAVFLSFLAYPAVKRSPRDRIPTLDWLFAFSGAFASAYLFLFYEELSDRPGAPTDADIWIAGIGVIALLEATRRALGPPLMIVALVFLAYVFFGDSAIVPEEIRWKGASFTKAMSHQWLTTEGVYGIALGVSTSFVFLFVLFGSLLDKAGAGNYFIQVAFSLLGHLRGGPAKAAVLASAMTGMISGSSIANVVTTGTFTIPLMRRVGFTAEQSGSVEVASSVNGQIMPPVMGAAAFLMVEYVGISYLEVIKHAFLPAVISYIALLYIVHLEALKSGMEGLPKTGNIKTPANRAIGAGLTISSVLILCGAIYYGILGVKWVFGGFSDGILALTVVAVYLGLIAYAAPHAELKTDDPNAEIASLPQFVETFKTGIHYILPIVVLVWLLMIERKSPGLSAFWATVSMIVILITQHPLKVLFRSSGDLSAATKRGWNELIAGLIAGARNMIGIGVATAAAGIIVGTVTLTGIGQVMTEFVEVLSGGNLIVMLVLVSIISLILGMGLPTTANYIVVSSLMAGVVVELSAANGLIVPLIAVHMFVFYFGIMADVTPPVGLASFAAAAISGGDPIKTGFTAFFYSLRTVILPFLFIFNTDLLLINVGWVDGIAVFVTATAAMLIFAAGTQGFLLVRSKVWESTMLVLIAFTLFRPGFWLDQIQTPFVHVPPEKLLGLVKKQPSNTDLRILVRGQNVEGEHVETTVLLPLGAKGLGATRLASAGIKIINKKDKIIIDDVFRTDAAGKLTAAARAGLDFDMVVLSAEVPRARMPKQIFYIPALLILAFIWFVQNRRRLAN
ncbi:MAG: TRAP transporter permease [Pseudomonadota bacterium]|nr:TRAP transporter permease [Pseudomonadota bacterium]